MNLKKILFITLILISLQSNGQQNMAINPEKPQAGQVINITYTSSGFFDGSKKPVELIYYTSRKKDLMAYDGLWEKTGNTYTAQIPTDTADNLVMLKIFSGDINDNNKGNGYLIPLYNGNEYKKGALYSMGQFYQYNGRAVGIDPDPAKALKYYDDEYQKYPEEKEKNLVNYLRVYGDVNPDKANAEIEKSIEHSIKNGLKDESDYSLVQQLYALNKLTQQSHFIQKIREEKFPVGKWKADQIVNQYLAEKDPSKKSDMYAALIKQMDENPDYATFKDLKSYFASTLLQSYIQKKDYDGLQKAIENYHPDDATLASIYNNTAWDMQGSGTDLPTAQKFSSFAATWSKKEMDNPTQPKPDYLTAKQWKKQLQSTYAMYADTYAMVEYKSGNYKKALPYTEDAAIKINNLMSADENNTYALVASKTLSSKKLMPILEKMISRGKATADIKDIFKKEYLKKHNEADYENHITELEKSHQEQMIAELKKSILNDQGPSFSLKDANGNAVDISALKGKVVVVDFWATWCGPCKASFPGMQKMVTQFKNDPDVKFLFVDTWETEDNKEKNAKDFITKNNYDFHVLMDNDNKVVSQFKVEGIPTKFVLDKNGVIRFKSVGYSGSTDGLVKELTEMIKLAKES